MKPQGHPAETNGGHEPRDAHVGGIFAVVLFLVIAGIVVHFSLGGFMGHLNKKPAPTDVWRSTEEIAAVPPVRPARPKLQISPPAELDALRVREESELNSYGWINRTGGIVRIPISRAIDLVLQKGLPGDSNAVGPSTLQLQQQRPRYTAPEIRRQP